LEAVFHGVRVQFSGFRKLAGFAVPGFGHIMAHPMIGRVAIVGAVIVWLLVTIGCLVGAPGGALNSPSGSSPGAGAGRDPWRNSNVPVVPAERRAKLPLRGVAMQLHRVDLCDPKRKDGYYTSVDEIAALGADTVKFVVNAQMQNGSSSYIYMDLRYTPDGQQLADLIKYAKGKGLRVVLMPIVLIQKPEGNEWRGTIKPAHWSDWWDSYRQMMDHYAMYAEISGVDLLVIGSELVSTEEKADEWLEVIRTVRKRYKGMITYSANWDHYKHIPFWDYMDVIGMNSYWKMGENRDVSPAEIAQRWQKIQEGVLGFAKEKGKPLILLEVGWCSLQNAAHEPWDYTQEQLPVDLELQKRLWEGFFQSWHGKPNFAGFMLWEWPPTEANYKPEQDKGYTPEGKPAEKTIREWLAKPGWQVQ
jgi:hypothetical protein